MAAPDVANNPYVQAQAEAIESQVNRNLMENILPQITVGGAQQTGAFGSSDAVARGLAAQGTGQVLSESLANLYGSAYGQGLGAQMGAFQMLPAMMTGQASLYGQAGALERAEAERALAEDRARFEFGQMEPWQRAQMAMGIALPMGTAFGEGEQIGTTRSTPSPFQQIGGLVGAGAMLAPSFGGFFNQPAYQPYQAFQMGGYYADPRRPWG